MKELNEHWSFMQNDKYVLYGVSLLGKIAIDNLAKVGIIPLAFVDDNPKLRGTVAYGLNVIDFQDAVEQFGFSVTYVLTMWRNIKDIMAKLITLGIPVMSFPNLARYYSKEFLPCFSLDFPYKMLKHEKIIKNTGFLWEDKISRIEYLSQIIWRINLDTLALPPSSSFDELYFPSDLFEPDDNEVFIDCGAYDGDTIKEFIKWCPSFKEIVAFEPDPENYKKLEEYKHTLWDNEQKKIFMYPAAVGLKSDYIHFTLLGSMSSYIGGTDKVMCLALDDLKLLNPTYIKMDIEGSELLALRGAENTIKEHLPILAICVYHLPHDLWEIPTYLHSMYPDYKLFLRRYLDEWCELICYAVPPNRLIK
jgi:FkbM family methyltransferase